MLDCLLLWENTWHQLITSTDVQPLWDAMWIALNVHPLLVETPIHREAETWLFKRVNNDLRIRQHFFPSITPTSLTVILLRSPVEWNLYQQHFCKRSEKGLTENS